MLTKIALEHVIKPVCRQLCSSCYKDIFVLTKGNLLWLSCHRIMESDDSSSAFSGINWRSECLVALSVVMQPFCIHSMPTLLNWTMWYGSGVCIWSLNVRFDNICVVASTYILQDVVFHLVIKARMAVLVMYVFCGNLYFYWVILSKESVIANCKKGPSPSPNTCFVPRLENWMRSCFQWALRCIDTFHWHSFILNKVNILAHSHWWTLLSYLT